MADRIGTQIAGYRVESLLSRGGMGEVYLAEQDSPRRKVALKFLSPELSLDAGFRERFARESEAAASIDHPNVIPIYQSGQADGALFIAMRYVEGTDLRTLLAEQGPLPPERGVHICAQIADALDAAHERGLVHRDVKPANILVGKSDHAYLSDFGLIRRSEVSAGITKTGHDRLRRPRAVRGQAAWPADRCVLARVRRVRMPGWRAAVPQGAGRRRDVRASPRSTTERSNAATGIASERRPGDREGDGEAARRSLRDGR
jgi:serine/threonine protein kinase